MNKSIYDIVATDATKFYKTTEWEKLRLQVLKLDHYECQRCKSKYKRIKRARYVHHVNELKDRPDLALSIYDEDGKRNLISLCFNCHEEIHDRLKDYKKEPLTKERW